MAAFIDGIALSNDQRVELYEEGVVWIIQTPMIAENAKPAQEIKLSPDAALALMQFLEINAERLQAPQLKRQKAELYNREMDERNRISAENIDKPWLPIHDGE